MPASSKAQRRYFGWLEHSNTPEAEKKKGSLTHKQMHDFAATPDKGLPQRKKK